MLGSDECSSRFIRSCPGSGVDIQMSLGGKCHGLCLDNIHVMLSQCWAYVVMQQPRFGCGVIGERYLSGERTRPLGTFTKVLSIHSLPVTAYRRVIGCLPGGRSSSREIGCLPGGRWGSRVIGCLPGGRRLPDEKMLPACQDMFPTGRQMKLPVGGIACREDAV